jgi:hypothetical protein
VAARGRCPSIHPCRHRFQRDGPASRNRGAGVGDHLSLTGKTLFLVRRGLLARGGKVGTGHEAESGHSERIAALEVHRHPYRRRPRRPPLLRFLLTAIRDWGNTRSQPEPGVRVTPYPRCESLFRPARCDEYSHNPLPWRRYPGRVGRSRPSGYALGLRAHHDAKRGAATYVNSGGGADGHIPIYLAGREAELRQKRAH